MLFDNYEEAYEAHLVYLTEYVKAPKGISQGYLIYDNVGEVTGRIGRITNNPKWYSEFYKEHGKKPTKADLRVLAHKHLTQGFFDEFGFIPPMYSKSDIVTSS